MNGSRNTALRVGSPSDFREIILSEVMKSKKGLGYLEFCGSWMEQNRRGRRYFLASEIGRLSIIATPGE